MGDDKAGDLLDPITLFPGCLTIVDRSGLEKISSEGIPETVGIALIK
jgi:hypothetical protein